MSAHLILQYLYCHQILMYIMQFKKECFFNFILPVSPKVLTCLFSERHSCHIFLGKFRQSNSEKNIFIFLFPQMLFQENCFKESVNKIDKTAFTF